MTNILVLVHGTEGDIRQLSRACRGLKNRGHTITVITHCVYEQQIKNEGLNAAFIDTPEEYEQLLRETGQNKSPDEHVAHFHRRVLPKLPIEYQLVRERYRPGETVLVTHSNSYLVARIIGETLGLPLATVFTAPAFLALVPIVESVLGKALGPSVNRIRAEFGLSPVGDWSTWWRKDSHPIAIWPDWFAPPEPDWPAELVQAGFLMTDVAVPGALPAEVETLLENGEPPVLVTGGTGMFVETQYYEACLEACRRLGRRVLLVARHQDFIPKHLPESVVLFSSLPFASVMPRVAAVIHHGGMGTTAQALASGVPQVILARGVDRPDNAQRVERLGIGKYLPSVRWQAGEVAEALASVIGVEVVDQRCRDYAQRIHEHDSLTPIADMVEALARDQRATPSAVSAAPTLEVTSLDHLIEAPAPEAMSAPKLTQLSQQRLELAARLLRQKNGNGKTPKAPTLSPESVTAAKALNDLSAEVALEASICAETLPPATTSEPANIFLTGATGFLGAFLLHELLRQTPATIYCLVRASGIDEGRQRLQKTLKDYELWDEAVNARIVPVPGNLSEPLLGLTEREFSRLAGTLEVIYHNGAQVNLFYPYAALKAPNVLGTQEVLRLACRTKAKPVHYISTLSVTSSLAHSGEGFHKGYTQTKWVAEQLVMLAGSRGLPVSIYRPGQIAGHSHTGACNPDDLLWQMIRGCIRLGSVPDLNDMRVDLTPVDFVSRAIVYLSRQAAASGQTFPLINPHSVPWQELVTWVTALGYPLRQVSYEVWRTELLKAAGQSEETALSSLAPIFSERTTLKPVALSAEAPTPEPESQTQPALDLLKGASILCPPTNADLMKTYLAYFRRCGFLEAN